MEVLPQERVQNRTLEQIARSPAPQIMEAVFEALPSTPQERVRFTWKVFTVRHHCGDQACAVDTLGFNIKGLDKFNLPRSGDVMVLALLIDVPVPQTAEDIVEWSVTRERIIERFGLSISWDFLEASLPPGLFQRLRQRAFEEEEEEEILASS